jgi:catechol 2,3-dioxygenase
MQKLLPFYETDLGLKSTRNENGDVELYSQKNQTPERTPLIVLLNDPKAISPSNYSAGLYHLGVLMPDRQSLTSTYLALGNKGVYFEGFADHLVSESLYLRDPEGNGIEIYRDRPKEEWFDQGGNIKMDTLPLDIDSMILELSKNSPDLKEKPVPFPHGATIGHLHLKVTDLDASRSFYHNKLGMDVTANSFHGASFLSYGGYHHHVGINTWESLGGPPHKDGEMGLDSFTLLDPDREIMNWIGGNESKQDSSGETNIFDPDSIMIKVRT